MNKKDAKYIAEKVSNYQLFEMLEKAKIGITDWTVRSSVNKGMTKGLAWNILAYDFDINKQYSNIVKVNMIWEFGDFIAPELKPFKTKKEELREPTHQEPKFK